MLSDRHLATVLFDDDTAIVSFTQVRVQGSWQAYKEENHISDRPKTEIMGFLGRPSHHKHQRQTGINKVEPVPAFKYLGSISQASGIWQEQSKSRFCQSQ